MIHVQSVLLFSHILFLLLTLLLFLDLSPQILIVLSFVVLRSSLGQHLSNSSVGQFFRIDFFFFFLLHLFDFDLGIQHLSHFVVHVPLVPIFLFCLSNLLFKFATACFYYLVSLELSLLLSFLFLDLLVGLIDCRVQPMFVAVDILLPAPKFLILNGHILLIVKLLLPLMVVLFHFLLLDLPVKLINHLPAVLLPLSVAIKLSLVADVHRVVAMVLHLSNFAVNDAVEEMLVFVLHLFAFLSYGLPSLFLLVLCLPCISDTDFRIAGIILLEVLLLVDLFSHLLVQLLPEWREGYLSLLRFSSYSICSYILAFCSSRAFCSLIRAHSSRRGEGLDCSSSDFARYSFMLILFL